MLLLPYINFKGFKLIDIELIDHNVLGTNKFSFIQPDDNPDSIYFSVLIGPNGTGKSELLHVILAMFRIICNLEREDSSYSINGYYRLNYLNDNDLYTFTNYEDDNLFTPSIENIVTKRRPYLLKNGIHVSFDNASSSLPKAIVANSIMLTDKYYVPRNDREGNLYPMYKYLGVRNRPQQASTRSYVRKTVEFVVEQIDSSVFKEGLNSITNFLGLSNSINIVFFTIYSTKFFTGHLQEAELNDFFKEIDEQYKNSETIAPFKLSQYKNLKNQEGLIKELCFFINGLVQNGRLEPIYRSSKKKLKYNIIDDQSHSQLKSDYFFLDIMRRIGIISPPDITLKRDDEIDLQDSSSGEFHFFSTMVALMATVVPNSLVLIDEPEISLHPNWQMQYLQFIRQLFSSDKYKTCQIIIATHSHFLISDLQGASSKIIGLKREKGKLKNIDINDDTYGWSAEQVLLDIFDVQSTRNYVIAERLGILLDLIAKEGSTKKEITNKFIELEMDKFKNLPDEDPLKFAYDTIVKEYINDKS